MLKPSLSYNESELDVTGTKFRKEIESDVELYGNLYTFFCDTHVFIFLCLLVYFLLHIYIYIYIYIYFIGIANKLLVFNLTKIEKLS